MVRRNRVPESVSMETPIARKAEEKRREEILARKRIENQPVLRARDPNRPMAQPVSLPEALVSKLPTGASRDLARIVLHGLARTGNTILRTIDIPNRVFGNTRSLLQDIYEKSEANIARDTYEDQSGVPQVLETAVHLASSGIFGKALPVVFGANVGTDTYETAKHVGASESEALDKGIEHGVVDTLIWTLGGGLASKYLPKAWQWLGRVVTEAGRGAVSSLTSDTVLNSLGADISGEEMAKHAAHAAWMVPLLGMLKMGGKRREEAMTLLRKARPDLAGAKTDKVIETIEAEFSDPKSQKVALAWVARKGANLPDDIVQIRQALEVAGKVKGLDPMSRSPFEILSNPAYVRYLPKPKPQDVKAFSNMKRYPMGVIGFDVSDDAAGRQATREMINAYMSPSSNPWCLATGKDAAKLGELGPGAEGYWKHHSAVPKQIFFQEVDGKLELTAFRATSPGGEGRQEYWDTSDAGYSGIPIKVKVPGDPMGRYRKMVFRPAGRSSEADPVLSPERRTRMEAQVREGREQLARIRRDGFTPLELEEISAAGESESAYVDGLQAQLEHWEQVLSRRQSASGEVQGTFEDIAPGKLFKGDPFRDGRSQTWVNTDQASLSYAEWQLDEYTGLQNEDPADPTWRSEADAMRETVDKIRHSQQYVLVEDKVRTTENGITKFRTTKYADPTNWDYEPPKPGEQPKPVEIEESELISPEWMRSRGYDPESESDVRRMQQELNIQSWGNGQEAAMAVVPTKRTLVGVRKTGESETITYGPDGTDIVSVDFEEKGVPYREIYGAMGNKQVPDEIIDAIDVRDTPLVASVSRSGWTGGNPWRPRNQEFRLVRNPDSESPEVLDEIKWDEGLGGYVRTIGNRRWRIDPDVLRLARTVERLPPVARAGAAASRRRLEVVHGIGPHYDWPGIGSPPPADLPQHLLPVWRSALQDRPPQQRWLIEDLQPDGTWAPAVDRRVNAETGEVVELPPPPPAVRTSDTRVGRRRAADDDDDDLPFALKAGRTRRNVRAAEGGGDAGSETVVSEMPVSEAPQNPGGPRIVINPQVFDDKRDALCVAFNEAFRIVMEDNGFEPVSEPTEKQRQFFADTAYADNELQLRRTILARIATLDTSVSDPTDEQLEETAEMLEMVMEVGAPQNDWEQTCVKRLLDVVSASLNRAKTPGNPLGKGSQDML